MKALIFCDMQQPFALSHPDYFVAKYDVAKMVADGNNTKMDKDYEYYDNQYHI